MLLNHSRPTKRMEAVDIAEDRTIIEAEEDVSPNVKEIGEVAVVSKIPVI